MSDSLSSSNKFMSKTVRLIYGPGTRLCGLFSGLKSSTVIGLNNNQYWIMIRHMYMCKYVLLLSHMHIYI